MPQITISGPLGGLFTPSVASGPDCLNLNIWTPDPGAGRLPVLVWIHGGGFQFGAGYDQLYDGTAFARDGVVTVTINYRLGSQGFLYVPESAGAGNYGLLDQILALEWVQENIAAFGGDPDNVTIAGESAGGMAVGILLASPRAKGLFRRAITQSGGCHNSMSVESAEAIAVGLATRLGIDPLDRYAFVSTPLEPLLAAERELFESVVGRQEPISELALAPIPLPFQPVNGTSELPEAPIDAVRAGSAAGIDLLVGCTSDEMAPMIRLMPALGIDLAAADLPDGVADLTAAMIFADGQQGVDQVIATYRAASRSGCNVDVLSLLLTDWSFRIPAGRLAEAHAAHAPVYAYELSWQSPGADGLWGAGHGLDVPLVFDNTDTPVGRYLTGGAAPRSLIEQMHGAWVAFATCGVPHHDQLPEWPTFDSARRATMFFDAASTVVDDPAPERRALWRGLLG